MNQQYFLLQDGNEAGPYTKHELMQIAIRPTDLVWIQGKSTSWQAAEHMEDLKDLITSGEVTSFSDKLAVMPVAASSKDLPVDSSNGRKKYNELNGLSHIYVRFPVSDQQPYFEEITDDVVTQPSLVIDENNEIQSSLKLADEKEAGNQQYRSLDEIRKEYATWIKQHEPSSKRRVNGKRMVALFFVVALLSIIMLALPKSTEELSPESVATYVTNNVHERVRSSASSEAQEESLVQQKSTMPIPASQSIKGNASSTDASHGSNKSITPVEQVKTENNVDGIARPEVSPTPVSNQPTSIQTEEKEMVVSPKAHQPVQASFPASTDANEKVSEPSPPITSLVDVKSNYVSNKKNGLTSLNVTVNNRSNKLLTLVAVDVVYYNANKELIGKKTLYFSNVKPGAEIKQDAAGNSLASTADCRLGLVSNGEAITYNKQ